MSDRIKKIANKIAGTNDGPVMEVLEKYWNTIHDLEYELFETFHEYDTAASYSGYPAEKDAEKLVKEILDSHKALEEISMKRFGRLANLERSFVKKYGTPEEYAEETRRKIFPA